MYKKSGVKRQDLKRTRRKLLPISRTQEKTKNKKVISVQDLLEIYPSSLLDDITEQTQADFSVKKLHAKFFFMLLLYGILKSVRLSTRLLETYYNSPSFTAILPKKSHYTRHSSISDRLARIPTAFFKALFLHTHQVLSELNPIKGTPAYTLKQIDSTLISLHASFCSYGLKNGYNTGQKIKKKQLKLTLTMKENMPYCFVIYSEQRYLSENLALGEAALGQGSRPKEIFVIDQGLSKRETFEKLTDAHQDFVCRIAPDAHVLVEKECSLAGALAQEKTVRLKGKDGKWTRNTYRFIEVKTEDGSPLCILSNIDWLEAEEIAMIYRKRWEIEVLFRFLKQEMNLKQITSYKPQAIENIIYMELLTAMLVLIYKKKNAIESYRVAKEMFVEEIQMHIFIYILKQHNDIPQNVIYDIEKQVLT